MRNMKKWLPCMLVMTGVLTAAMNVSAANIQKDHLAFAKCEDKINIRSQANTDSAIVGILHNKNAVTVLEIVDDEWCLITSGKVLGYMKYKHLIAGEEAWAIDNEVARTVAIVHPRELNVHATASEEGQIIDVVTENQELNVVSYDGGSWVKVELAPDSIGYIDASYCSTKTYYPVADLISEEALAQVQMPYTEMTESDAYTEAVYDEGYYEEPVYDTSYDENYATGEYYEEEADYNWDGSYEEPTYEEPSYEEPTYEEPSYEEPTYEEPAYEQPTYEEPTYETPSYEEPTYDWNGSYDDGSSYGGGESYDYGYEEPSNNSGSGSSGGQAIVDYALQFVGNPYVYGGNSLTNGTDCSGFTQSVMSNFGIDLSRTAADQSYGGQSVDLQDIQAGDLLFYSDGGGISHVAIYAGDGQIVHAATEEKGIIVSDSNYSTPVGAARYW